MNIGPKLPRNPLSGPPARRPREDAAAPQVVEPADKLTEIAKPHEKDGFSFKKAAFQFGLAMNTIAGAGSVAQAAPQELVAETRREASRFLDLALRSRDSVQSELADSGFVRQDFDHRDLLDSLQFFADNGSLTAREGRTNKTFTAGEAASLLEHGQKVSVKLSNGRTVNVSSPDELQILDTFNGASLKPVAAPSVVNALRAFEAGIDADDGIVVDGASFTSERKVGAFEAYKFLVSQERGHGTKAAMKGGLIGLGAALGVGAIGLGAAAMGAGGLAALAPTIAGLSGATVAVAGGAAAAAAATGATVGYISYQNAHPEELEVRYGQDAGLMIKSPEHAAETYQWLVDRQANPFTDDQQRDALQYLDSTVGLYQGRKDLTADDALQRLHKGQSVQVKGPLDGHPDTIDNLRDLQVLDTIRGKGVNPVFSEDMRRSLRLLESGQSADGFYQLDKVDPKSRLTAFEAAERLFWDRQAISSSLHGKSYTNTDLRSVQELNALKGDRINSILPQAEYESLQLFDENHILRSAGQAGIDSYEALQALRSHQPVKVKSNERVAIAQSTRDLQELRALEFTNQNDILDPLSFSMLQFWNHRGGYKVDYDGQADHAYEALQALQSGRPFEVKSEGRFAPASSYQDLQDLAAFEAPEADFPNTVPSEAFDRLSYFQKANESAGSDTSRVQGRTGRAYEAYRELRDGDPFEIKAGEVWNRVNNLQDLHDLDALLGRGVNDILPRDQYDLLKELADAPVGEGLSAAHSRLNSYATLQRFRQGQSVSYEFHGGDFGELLEIPTAGLNSLSDTKKLLHDQKEYDRYAYSVGEWQDKMSRQAAQTPELAQDNLEYGQQKLRDGEHKLSRGQSDLTDAEGDLRRAQSDLRDAEWDLSRAYAMPYTTTESRQTCDDNGCHTEYYEEHNYSRDWAISRAQSDVSDAERDIRRARSDISEAESLISEAHGDISRAHTLINEAQELLGMLGNYRDTLSKVNESNYQETLRSVKAALARMESLSNISTLDGNLVRQERLIRNMSRPARPQGYQVPERLVQS